MSSGAFAQSLPFVLRWEGGFVDHPSDPGGRTNKGVTQAVYDRWRARQGLSPQDVKLIDPAEVNAIYEIGYWVPPCCDRLPRLLDLAHFDTAVNMGPGRAVRLLQRCMECEPDGDFGPQTQRAVAECDVGDALRVYCDAREAYYRNLAEKRSELRVFLKGWLNRLNALRREIGLPGAERVWDGGAEEIGYAARVPDLEGDPRGF